MLLVVESPPVVEMGHNVIDENTGGFSVRVAAFVTPFAVAEMVTGVDEDTANV